MDPAQARILAGLDEMDAGFAVFDEQLRLVYCNARYPEIRGYPAEICRPGTPLAELFLYNARRGDYGEGDEASLVEARIAQVRERRGIDVDQTLGDGRILSSRYRPLADGGLATSYEDVTVLRRTNASLRAEQERYKLVTEAISEGIYDWDIAADSLHVTDRLNRIFDFASGELTASDWAARVHPDDLAGYAAAMRAHFKGQTPQLEATYRIRDATGGYRWVEDQAQALLDGDGRAVRLVGAIADISDRKAAEQALQDSEERYALAMSAIKEGIYEFDLRTDDVYYSPSIYKEMGISADEMKTTDDWLNRIHPDDLPNYKAAMVAHLRGETPRFLCEVRYRHLDGSYHWARQHGTAVRDESGRAVRIVGSTGDITAEKNLAEELQRTQQRLAESLESISQGFALFDAEDRLVMRNDVYRRYFAAAAGPEVGAMIEPGVLFADYLGKAHANGMFPDTNPDTDAFVAATLERRRAPTGGREIRLRDGIWLYITERRTGEGGLVAIFTDITDVKHREAELKRAQTRLTESLEPISQGFVLFDSDDRLVMCNARYRQFFVETAHPDVGAMVVPGMKFEDFVRAAFDKGMFPEVGEDREAFLAARLERRRNPREEGYELRLRDGTWLSITERRTAEGGLVALYTDITSVKLREAELQAARDRAEAALADLRQAQDRLIHAEKMASLGQLTAGIAHEIKNPLNFVNNFSKLSAEMMDELAEVLEAPLAALGEDERDDAEDLLATVRDNLVKIDQHGRRADSIVKNMLLHSRDGGGETHRVDLNAVALEAMNLAYHGARAADSGFNIEIESDLAPTLGPIDGQPQELQRVFLNLCSNGMYAAAKRAAAGGEAARLTVRSRMEDGACVVDVIDNGDGVPAAVRDKIFQPFFTTKPTGEGTGLGLSMSYDIVKQHGGEISLQSEAGQGTTFSVRLPVAAGGEAAS